MDNNIKYLAIQVIPYFGKWPEYFDLYLFSCSRNTKMKFIFYTDCPLPSITYPNTIFNKITYSEYCLYVSKKLKINFTPPNPYKLADLKPFMAFLHSEDFRDIAFWSFGDLDLCFGDLANIFNSKYLNKYDLITTHNYHIAGHFTLIRNERKMNNLCFKIPNWQSLLEVPFNIAVDEIYFSNIVFPSQRYIVYAYNKIIRHISKKLWTPLMDEWNKLANKRCLFKEFNTTPEPKENEIWIYNLKSGKLYDPNGLELPYLHFLFFKNHPFNKHWPKDYYKLQHDIISYNKILITINSIDGI